MAGARYDEWAHVQVAGEDRAAGAPYLSYARKLLGFVAEDASRNSLLTHQLTRTLPDGAVVTAELRGGIPRMVIFPPPVRAGTKLVREFEDAVVFARTAELPLGIAEDNPEQILRQTEKQRRTFFFSGSAAYDEFDGRRGVYIDAFPEGLRHYGNVDWVGLRDERISWYGPSSRMFVEPYVQPRSQYGRKVFMLGKDVLDLALIENVSLVDHYVLGAALRRTDDATFVYFMHAELPVGEQGVVGDTPANTVEVSYPTPDVAVTVNLGRVRLSLVSDFDGFMPYAAQLDSYENLGSVGVARGVQPWRFNASATQATSAAEQFGSSIFIVPASGPSIGPAASASFLVFVDTDTGEFSVEVSTLEAGLGTTAFLAYDYKGDTLVGLGVGRVGEQQQLGFVTDTANYQLAFNSDLTGFGTTNRTVSRRLLHADLRSDVFVFIVEDFTVTFDGVPVAVEGSVFVEFHRNGEIEATVPCERTLPFFTGLEGGAENSSVWSPKLAEHDIAPMWAVYGLFVRQSFGFTGLYFAMAMGNPSEIFWPEADLFGFFGVSGTTPRPRVLIPTKSLAGYSTNVADANGHVSVFDVAITEYGIIASGCGFGGNSPDDYYVYGVQPARVHDASIAYATSTTLPQFTGVTGTNERFHPCWVLGKPPLLGQELAA